MSESFAENVRAGASAFAGEFPVLLKDDAVVRVRYLGSGPRIIISHGNGLAIDAYRSFSAGLSARHQVVMFDFRHHGQSSPFKSFVRNWPQFVEDLERILAAIELKLGKAPTFGAFHSMSALTALLHAAERPTPWTGLVTFEPPVPPGKDHPLSDAFYDMHAKLAEGAARRRPTFAAPEDLARSFAGRDAFRRLNEQALHELASATLRPNVTGTFDLACDRDFEAETFRLGNLGDAWGRVSSLNLPVKVVAGIPGPDENHCLSKLARAIAKDGGFEFAEIPDATHFLQLERPSECIAAVEHFVQHHLQTL